MRNEKLSFGVGRVGRAADSHGLFPSLPKKNLARYVMVGAAITVFLLSNGASVWAQTTASRVDQSALPRPKYGHCADVRKDDLRSCGNVNSGKGYAVCEAYLRHLNTLKETPYCQAPVPPGFKSPDWEELDVLQHLDWAYWMDIRFRAPAGYTPPDFESWRKAFLDKLQAGKISPHMRQTRIKPLGADEATILAFTRDRLACTKGFRKDFDDDKWGSVGYMHWELTGDSRQPLRALGENNSQSELLLFSGKPYFVQPGIDLYGADFSNFTSQPIFYVYEFFARQQHDDGLHYETMQLCYLEPDNPLGIVGLKRTTKKK